MFKYRNGILFSVLFISSLVLSYKYTDPFFVPKNLFFFFAAAVFIFVASMKYFSIKFETKFDYNFLDILLFSFIVYSTIRLFFTEGVSLGNVMYLQYLTCFIIYFLIQPLLFIKDKKIKPNNISIIITILLFISIAQCFWGIAEYTKIVENSQKNFRIGAAYGNPGQYANFITPLFAFALAIFLFSKKKNKNLALISGALLILVIPLTQARTSWIAIVAMIIYLIDVKYQFIFKAKTKFNKKRYFIGALALLVALAVVAGNWLYNHKKDSSSGRLFIWKVSAEMIADKPIWGFGFDRFSPAHNDYQAVYFKGNPDDHANAYVADGVNYAFNEWIQVAVETGIPGALLLLAIIVFSLAAKIKEEADDECRIYFYAAKAGMIAIAVSAMFSYPLHIVSTLALFFFFLSIISSLKDGKSWKYSIKPSSLKTIFTIVLLFALCLFLENYKRNSAERKWVEAFQLMRQSRYEEAYAIYNKVYDDLEYNQFFLFNYGAELSLMQRYDESIKVLKSVEPRLNDADYYIYLGNSYENIGNFTEAEKCYLKAGNIIPSKFFPRYKMVNIYIKTNRLTQAIQLAEQIVNTPVKVQSPFTDSILKEMRVFLNQYK